MRRIYQKVLQEDKSRCAIQYGTRSITYGELIEGNLDGASDSLVTRIAALLRGGHEEQHEDAVIFVANTSGSTGSPKEIHVRERVFMGNLWHWVEEGIIQREDRVLLVHAPTFDPWYLDVLASLWVGATLLVPPSNPADFRQLVDFCRVTAPTLLHCTPSFLFRIPIEFRIEILRHVARQVATGGEPPCPWSSLALGLVPLPPRYMSFYGTTELSVWSSVLDLRDMEGAADPRLAHLGTPMRETKLWLVDSRIAMSRAGVEVITTDLGSLLQDGAIAFRGRADRVRKVFGKSFSLDDMERLCLAACSFVRRVRVELVDEVDFVCFAELKAQNVQRKIVKNQLKRVLPCRTRVMVLDDFPTNVHAKVSPQALLSRDAAVVDSKRLRFRGRPRLVQQWLARLPVQHGLLLEQLDSIVVHRIALEFSRLSGLPQDVALFLYTPVEQLAERCCSAITAAAMQEDPVQHLVVPPYSIVWQVRTGKCVDAAPIMLPSREICVPCHDGMVYFIAVDSGRVRWSQDLGDRIEVAAFPARDETAIWCGTRGGLVVQIAVAGPRVDITSSLAPLNGSCKGLCVVGDSVVIASSENGLWVSYLLQSWEQLSPLSFLCAPRLSADGSRLVAVSTTGVVLCFGIVMSRLELEWEVNLSTKRPAGHVFLSSATFGPNGGVWVSSVSTLYCIRSSDDEIMATSLPMQSFRSPTFDCNEETVLVAGEKSVVVASAASLAVLDTISTPYIVCTNPVWAPDGRGCFALGTQCGRILVLGNRGRTTVADISVCPGVPIFSDPLWDRDTIIVGTRANSIVKLVVGN